MLHYRVVERKNPAKKEELGSSQRFFKSRTLAGFPQSSAMAVKEEMIP